jgi:ADP-ribose pyrophosphatase YjhB (NUDIX family)
MAKSSKLVAARNGRVLLVRRRRDGLWMFPGGRKRGGESARRCLQRELSEELPRLRLGSARLWRKVKGRNPISGARMSDAIFLVKDIDGDLVIGDPREIDRAEWRRPWGLRLTPTSRFIRDQLFRRRKAAGRRKRRGD